MFADDLALVSDSASELKSMLNIVSSYADRWRYKLNLTKSSVLVMGESTTSRNRNQQTWQW